MTVSKATKETEAFISRVTSVTDIKGIQSRFGCIFSMTGDKHSIKISIRGNNVDVCINIPAVYVENGIQLIEGESGVVRAVNNFFSVGENKEIPYYEALLRIIIDNPTGIVPSKYVKQTAYVNCLAKSIDIDAMLFTFMTLNRAINYVVNSMPLHTTYMESWVKNQRLIFIDPKYDEISNPEEELKYHVEKNKSYYDRGWTSIGLSDSSLSGKNVMLKTDLRKFVPFGNNFHNPQRNLHSTLGMLGDETPILMTKSLAKMHELGACWTGWNLFTLFVDVPDVWEDQILVDKSHADKYVDYSRKVMCPGNVIVKVSDTIHTGDVLAVNGTRNTIFDIECDSAFVEGVVQRTEAVGGASVLVNVLSIKVRRFLKDGTKITNMSANKGIIRLKDLGFATDPMTGERKRIDVIVSARAVLKRKNYGQLLEAVFNSINNSENAIIEDDAVTSEELIHKIMTLKGFNESCTHECDTYMGKLQGICGDVFWGVTHDADDTSWSEHDVRDTNSASVRKKGLKFSPIEFKALETRFGRDNAIIREILSYSQGVELVTENLRVLEALKGKRNELLPVINLDKVSNIEYGVGNMLTKESIVGTIADPNYHKDGFYIRLPFKYKVVVDAAGEVIFEGPVIADVPIEGAHAIYTTDLLYAPCGNLRQCWEHSASGLYGVSLAVSRLKAVISGGSRYLAEANSINYVIFANALQSYINGASHSLGSKKGAISIYGMSVRYPFSCKGVASLSNRLPKNTIEIHESMANTLRVKEGDVVIVERFPCLGFMSVRPQQVKVTKDPLCRYTVRVSGNSLGSLSLDFDGDVLYVASFQTEAAKRLLKKEWQNPNRTCYDAIKALNSKMGHPVLKQMSLADYSITKFEPLTKDKHAEIVGSLTGVKAHTGPVVALAYNVMRIMENSGLKPSTKLNVGVELFLDKVANSVFKQKHGVASLHSKVTEAICKADVAALIAEGFDEATSNRICEVIKDKAKQIGIKDVVEYYYKAKKEGKSSIINLIVRKQNKIYFACRAQQNPIKVLECLTAEAVDVPSKMFKLITNVAKTVPYTKLDSEKDAKLLDKLNSTTYKEGCQALFSYMDNLFGGIDVHSEGAWANG